MHLIHFLPVLAQALLANAHAIQLAKRGNEGLPCPYKADTTTNIGSGMRDQWTNTCPTPSKFKLNSNGNCGKLDPNYSCAAYCEEFTGWFYGPEIKYSLSPCHARSKCQITITDTTTVTNAYTVNFGIKGIAKRLEALNVGFSYQYSIAKARSKAISQTADEGFCGYWTFLPIYWASWGTVSSSEIESYWMPDPDVDMGRGGLGKELLQCKGPIQSEKVYNYQPIVVEGEAYGETVFVKTNCETGKKLCKKHQVPSYRKQIKPTLKDVRRGWYYQDDKDCADSAGVDGEPVPTNPNVKPTASQTSLPAASTGIGRKCSNNDECDAGLICFSGRCSDRGKQ